METPEDSKLTDFDNHVHFATICSKLTWKIHGIKSDKATWLILWENSHGYGNSCGFCMQMCNFPKDNTHFLMSFYISWVGLGVGMNETLTK